MDDLYTIARTFEQMVAEKPVNFGDLVRDIEGVEVIGRGDRSAIKVRIPPEKVETVRQRVAGVGELGPHVHFKLI